MFLGTIPKVISQYIYPEIVKLKPKRAFSPFAGNFVIEQLIAKATDGKCQILSSDVSIYSVLIGMGLSDKPFACTINEEHREKFPVFKDTSPEELAISVIFYSEMSEVLTKYDKFYYKRIADQTINNLSVQEQYYETISKKVRSVKESMQGALDFYAMDAFKLLDNLQEGDFLFLDPPTIEKGYEKMFSKLDEIFNYEKIEYRIIDDRAKIELLNSIEELGIKTMFRCNPDFKEFSKSFTQVYDYNYKNGKHHYTLYSNIDRATTWVGHTPSVTEKVMNYPIMNEDDEITLKSRIDFIPVDAKVGNHYRLMWIKNVSMTDGGYSLLVVIDGKVAGVVEYWHGREMETDLILFKSDVCAPNTRYARLSKLIVNLGSTQQMIDYVNEKSMWWHRGFCTLAVSKNPSSMKYRHIYKLVQRVADDTGKAKFKLTYQNDDKIFPTKKAAFLAWFNKDGKVINKEAEND